MTGSSSDTVDTAQGRQAQLIEEFAQQHPELREAVEIFGVASMVYERATEVAEPPVEAANNLTVP